MPMKPEIILISFGPHQLLMEIALLFQQQKFSLPVGVVSYKSEVSALVEFEKEVCEIFGFEYLGSLNDFRDIAYQVGFGSLGRIFSTFCQRDLSERMARWLKDYKGFGWLVEKELFFSYRNNLVSDILLLQVLKPAKLSLVADGYFLATNRNLKNRIASYCCGIKKYFSQGKHRVYCPDYLCHREFGGLSCETLKKESLQYVYGETSEKLDLESLENFKGMSVTLLLWQNLYPNFVSSKSDLFSFFGNLLREESARSDNLLLIKPHPRSTTADIDELRAAVPDNIHGRVDFVPNECLAVPVEVLAQRMDLHRVVGIASSGLLSLAQQNSLDVAIYAGRFFSLKLCREVESLAASINAGVHYV